MHRQAAFAVTAAQPFVMGVGALAEIVAWRIVVSGRASIWRIMTPTFLVMAVAAVIVREPVLSSRVGSVAAALAGAGVGITLFLGTRVFLVLASRWTPFQRQTAEIYGRRGPTSLAEAAMLAGVAAVCEELFWRGLFQSRLAEGGRLPGAVLTWVAYVAVNLPSVSLPIVAGAFVGGAVWVGLAAWTGGVLASIVCHLVWTELMLVLPPRVPAAVSG